MYVIYLLISKYIVILITYVLKNNNDCHYKNMKA